MCISDCGFEAHKKCSEKVPPDCMPDIKFVKNLFGADLTTVIKACKAPFPVVVEKCIKEIEKRGIKSIFVPLRREWGNIASLFIFSNVAPYSPFVKSPFLTGTFYYSLLDSKYSCFEFVLCFILWTGD